MRLRTINNFLRCFGLVLVVAQTEPDEHEQQYTVFRIERHATWLRRFAS